MPNSLLIFEIILGFLGVITIGAIIFFARKKQWILFTISVLVCAVLIWGRFVEPYQIKIREFVVEKPELQDLKIVLLSDFHTRYGKKTAWIQKIVDKVNTQNPDYVFIAGDFLYGNAKEQASFFEPLKQLKAPTYAVLGNHDYRINKKQINTDILKQKLKSFGVTVLSNEIKPLPQKNIAIAGVKDNYLKLHDFSFLDKFRQKDKTSFVLLLAHSPDILDQIPSALNTNIFMFTGHTHCGQIKFPFIGVLPFIVPVSNKKLIQHFAEKDLFITCGLGETGPLVRLLNPPEIAVLNFSRKK